MDTEKQEQTQIQKEQEKILNFYTDPASPYVGCPEPLKKLFDAANNDGEIDEQRFIKSINQLEYPIKKTVNNFCSRFFTPQTELYYVCQTCTQPQNYYSTMCYCQTCFEAEKHVGHNYYTNTAYSDGAYCDCGRIQRFKKQSFCKGHADYNKILDCEDFSKQLEQFKTIFSTIIEANYYKQISSETIQFLCNYFSTLNEGSVYYNRMTFQFLKMKSKSRPNLTYLQIFMTRRFDKLLIHIGGDLKTRMQIIKFMFTNGQNGSPIIENLGSSESRELFNNTTCQALINEGFYHQKFIQVVENTMTLSKDLKHYIQKLKIQKSTSLDDLSRLSDTTISEKLIDEAVKKLVDLYPDSQLIKAQIKEERPDQVGEHYYVPSQINQANHFLLSLISQMIIIDPSIKFEIRKQLIKKGISEQKLNHISQWLAKNAFSTCTDTATKNRIMNLFLLIKDNKKLVDEAWSSILSVEPSVQQIKLLNPVDYLHSTVVRLVRSDLYFVQNKKITMKQLQLKVDPTQSAQDAQVLKGWFENLLYQRKSISRSEVLEFRSQGVLSFKGVGQILNDLCSYNQQTQLFNYSSSKVFLDPLTFFPLQPYNQNFEALYQNPLQFNQHIELPKNSFASYILPEVLLSERILEALNKNWEAAKSHADFESTQYKCGYLYLFALVMCDCFSNGQNKNIRQRLLQIVKKEQLKQFYKNQDEKTLVYRLLGLNKEEKHEPEEISPISASDKKKLFDQKKKKLNEKYKKTQEIMLERRTSLKNSVSDEQLICILCHQKEKQSNSIFYPSFINKNATTCGALYGANNLTKTNFNTCFHPLHLNCYIELGKSSDFTFDCPLCHLRCNCVIPAVGGKDDKTLERICRNTVICAMVGQYKIYDPEPQFNLIFKHLIESCGLGSILDRGTYLKRCKAWAKNNSHMKNYLIRLHDASSKQEKEQQLIAIEGFIKQTEACPKNQCKLIQVLFAETLRSILTSADQVKKLEKLLLTIRSLLKEQQFQIIYSQFLFLLEEDIELPAETEEQKSKEKTELSYKFVSLLPNAADCNKKYAGKKCMDCKQQPIGNCENVCLICAHQTCDNCAQSHNSSAHENISMSLILRTLQVEANQKNGYSNIEPYMNQFKLLYREKSDYSDMDNEEEYLFNEQAFQKFFKKFLEN